MEYKKSEAKESLSTFDFESADSRPGRKLLSTRCRGVATLPTVMVIGIMALAVAVGVTAVALTESFISQGSNQSSKALFFAEAGARDALLRVARDKTFATSSYTIDFTTNGTGCSGLRNGCATIAVGLSPRIATSTGAMGATTRTVVVNITQDADGAIATSTTTWSESTN